MLTTEEALEIKIMYVILISTLIVLYSLYAIRFFEISKNPWIAQTIDNINFYLKNAIIVLLIWYFNPIRKPVRFTEFHRELVFNAAFFLLGSSLISIGMSFIRDLPSEIKKIEKKVNQEVSSVIEGVNTSLGQSV